MFFYTNDAFAADITVGSVTYNGNDFTKLQTFLNLNSAVAGKTNGKMINTAYDENDPATWSGIVWTEDAIKRVKSISWSKKSLSGDLDISGCESLTMLVCDSNSLTSLNVTGNTKLTSIRCNTNKLTSLDLSTNLKLDTLYCHTNNLSTLDLSANTSLLYLYCYSNKLTEINVSACALLNEFYCYSNLLTSIDVSSNTLLSKFACESNKLTALDVSKNTALTYLACYSNKISALDVSSNTNLLALHCYTNEISHLDLSKNVNLTTLSCNNNPLGELDVSYNTKLTSLRCDLNKLTELDVSKNTELTYLQCDTNKLTTLDVSQNTKLNDLRCYSNQLTELNLQNNVALTKLVCDTNKLTNLDVSKNVLLTSLACYSNQIGSLDLSANTSLVYLYCQENKLSQLDVSNNTELKELFCYGNQLTALDVSKNIELVNLRCYSNKLSELSVDKNIALTQLVCYSNQITELNLSNNMLLTNIDCSSNQLTELDVSNNTALTTIHCQFNNLTELDVSNNELLTELWCHSNNITSLNISQNTNLKTVWCYTNKLTSLDLSKSKGLDYLKCNDNYLKDIKVNVSNKSIDIAANGNGYVELSRNSVFQFYVVAVPHSGSIFDSWTQAGTKVSDSLTYNLVSGNSYDLKANFSQNIVFDSQGGSDIISQVVDYGSKITQPENPIKAGFEFGGWYKEAECINEWDFETDTVTQNIILYAKWVNSTPLPTVYTVTFNVDGGSAVPAIVNIASGSKITQPENPIKAEFEFGGWYKEAECINEWDFETDTVTQNIILYAKWVNSTPLPTVYTVTFNVDGGSVVPAIANIASGSKITQPENPIKAGFEFGGWYKESECINEWDFATDTVTQNIILYAKWTAKEPVGTTFVVMFDSNGGSKVSAIKDVIEGSKITEPAEPTKTGYDFKGWYTNSALTDLWDFATDTVNEDMILYAKWVIKESAEPTFVVVFDSNGGSKVSAIKGIIEGSTITEPLEPTKEGYIFEGWYKNSALTDLWDFTADTVTEDTILYAKWTAITPQPSVFIVKFNSTGGSIVPDINVTSGSAITVPLEPTKEGYTFAGWYKEAEYINAWDFDIDVVNENIILYAKWTEKEPLSTCTVMFDSNGGSKVAAIKDVIVGSTITEPPKPTKEGYDFEGWYKNSALTVSWDFATDKVTEDIILYAKWKVRSSGSVFVPSVVTQNDNNAPIIVNGKTEYIAKSVTENVDGKEITRIIVDDKKLSEKIEQIGMYPKAIIPINTVSQIKITELNGQTVKNMEDKGAVFEIVAGEITYTLPANQVNIGRVREEIGQKIELKDINVIIKISDVSTDIQNLIRSAAQKNNYEVITKPVEFSITCTNGNKVVDVSKFNKYVKRTIAIPNSADSGKITTGIVLNDNGTLSHVPTAIEEIDGKYYAKINSLTNSVYSVIWSPKRFNDVEGHWSKAAVNDMGSRLVISGVGNEIFQPDNYITRAEFAEIIVKGLGLMRIGTFKSSFEDVDKSAWYYNSVAIASEYGLISGYNNREFRPNNRITREEAMTIIAKAMKITGLNVQFSLGEVEDILKSFGDIEQASYWAKESIAACVKAGIVSGRNGHRIAPDGNMTRAETAVIVRNLLMKSELI
ncbi:InlB B-repeat-containing protein [Ruminiclostridium herbifermentans]|uniref:InlB B-repeat-containing protein n=2 Tax=Ruminiclostridium herbifermentans TaxID=2488810 RepID=A0A7H1VKN9_9FIRM|nr:InlB B-repeat-containing protein [Ruminiclostridium herbifermentans]